MRSSQGHLSPVSPYTLQYERQPTLPPRPNMLRKKKSAWTSMQDVARTKPARHEQGMQSNIDLGARLTGRGAQDSSLARSLNRTAAYGDVVAARLNEVVEVLASMDAGDEPPANRSDYDAGLAELAQHLSLGEEFETSPALPRRPTASDERLPREQGSSRSSLLNFHKSWQYANSRLPPHMMPFKVYMPTWQILCRAADASQAAYERPRRGQREEFIEADWKRGTKAMVLKSTLLDDQNLIVIAIRGSQFNIVDWTVNFTIAPTQPTGFLDDDGNAVHEGFLQVAKSMVPNVAGRLRQLLEQNPSRAASSLLITGHSAGGAVATLLFMHMLSRSVESELSLLSGCFKRLHCVTFGAPPLSLLPLQKPKDRRIEKNIFLSFVNEGDLVVRAGREYIKSWFKLLAAPSPSADAAPTSSLAPRGLREKVSMCKLQADGKPKPPPRHVPFRIWPVPDELLSSAGRLVLLRAKHQCPGSVEAVGVTDQQLRSVVFGDPAMHEMAKYQQRIESLAFAAVTGKGSC